MKRARRWRSRSSNQAVAQRSFATGSKGSMAVYRDEVVASATPNYRPL